MRRGTFAIWITVFALAMSVDVEAKCASKNVTEYATATNRNIAERNAKAKLERKLRGLGGEVGGTAETARIDCKHPLLWHCQAAVTICK